MAAIFAFHGSKAVLQVPAIEVTANDLLQIGSHNVERSYYLSRKKSDAGSKTRTLNRKDAVLFKLVARYRQDNRHRDIAPLFIVLLRIENSPRFAAESFKRSSSFLLTSSVD